MQEEYIEGLEEAGGTGGPAEEQPDVELETQEAGDLAEGQPDMEPETQEAGGWAEEQPTEEAEGKASRKAGKKRKSAGKKKNRENAPAGAVKKKRKRFEGLMEKMNAMRIEKRLRNSFVLVAIIASLSSVVAIGLLIKISIDSNNTLNDYGFASADLGRALTCLTDTRRCVRDTVHCNDEADVQEAVEDFQKANEEFDKYFKKVKSTIRDSEGKMLIREIESELLNYRKMAERFSKIGQMRTMEDSRVQDLMKTEMDPYYQKLYNACNKLFQNKQEQGNSVQFEMIVLCVVAVILVIAVMGMSVLLSNKLGRTISSYIARPLEETIHAAQSIARGDLNINVTAEAGDELGDLNRAFIDMSSTLKNVIKDINYLLGEMAEGNFDIETQHEESYVGELAPILHSIQNINYALSSALSEINIATVQFSGASGNLAETATGLAEGASDQAGAVDMLLRTTGKVTQEVENSSHSVALTSERMAAVGAMADEGRKKMDALTEAMEKINESSRAISEVVTTIENIADQTSLLSLNASIEAARAGEFGKGFAVVAGEIGKLASESGEAVNDTRKLVETSLAYVERGNAIAADTTEALQDMLGQLQDAVVLAEQARTASDAQVDAMKEIDVGMEKISEVVQSNSASAEETSATSQELSAQAETIASLVSRFRLREEMQDS